MEINVNIKLEANEAFCKALDNLANTLTAAACVAAPPMVEVEAVTEPEETVTKPAEKVSEPKEKVSEPEENIRDVKALRAELKSVMAKAAKDGKTEAVKALLAELGVSKLSQIPEDKLEDALEKAGDI
jgi:hypothetical protein